MFPPFGAAFLLQRDRVKPFIPFQTMFIQQTENSCTKGHWLVQRIDAAVCMAQFLDVVGSDRQSGYGNLTAGIGGI